MTVLKRPIIMNYIHTTKMQSEKEEFLFVDNHQRMNSDILTIRIFSYVQKLKMTNTYIKETEKDTKKLQITQDGMKKRLSLSNK